MFYSRHECAQNMKFQVKKQLSFFLRKHIHSLKFSGPKHSEADVARFLDKRLMKEITAKNQIRTAKSVQLTVVENLECQLIHREISEKIGIKS